MGKYVMTYSFYRIEKMDKWKNRAATISVDESQIQFIFVKKIANIYKVWKIWKTIHCTLIISQILFKI